MRNLKAFLIGLFGLALLVGTAHAVIFDVPLDTNQAIPAPVLNGTTPAGTASVDVNTITGQVGVVGSYIGMTSNVAAAHLHGLAGPGETAGVIFGFSVDGGTQGSFTGSDTLSAENLAGLLAGTTYLNVHTANNAPGEIRGQVVDDDIRAYKIALDAGQVVPPPDVTGATPSGSGTIVVDTSSGQVEITGTYTGMTSDVQAAHLHGLAPPGEAVGVIFPLDVSGGVSGTFSGSSILSSDNLAGLLAGQTYINVHTSQNAPGEIRGQVVPEPTSLALLGSGLAGLLLVLRRKGCR